LKSARLWAPAIGLAAAIAAGQTQTPPDRSKAPEPGPVPALHFPAIQQFSLANGIPVLFVERHGVPLLAISLVLRVGGSADPAPRPGLASLTASMLERGAAQRSTLEISDTADSLGAQLRASAGWDATIVSINVPSAQAEKAVALLSDLVTRPTFPNDELERVRHGLLTRILQRRDQPTALATFAVTRALYPSHPYGHPLDGTEASVQATNRADLQDFHDRFYTPENATLIVAGDATADRARALLAEFSLWKATDGSKTKTLPLIPPPAPQPSRRQIWLVDKPGAAQSEIRVARIAPPRATPDYFSLVVANTVLGGSFTSRLNHNLRTEHGYTYGAYSRFDFRVSTGPFFAGAAVQTDKTAPALSEFFKELARIGTVTPEDLVKAKNYVALRYPAQFETIDEISGKLVEKVIFGQPDNYFEQFLPSVQAVTAEEVRRAVGTFDPERVVVIVVGDASRIEKEITALRLGPIRKLSIDDLLGAASKPATKS
jgi:zinc protease